MIASQRSLVQLYIGQLKNNLSFLLIKTILVPW